VRREIPAETEHKYSVSDIVTPPAVQVKDVANREIERRAAYRPPFSCLKGQNGTVLSLGTVIGFTTAPEIGQTGVRITYDHGEKSCHTTVDVICDVTAGHGAPVMTSFRPLPTDCAYQWIWKSLYGCRYCRSEDFFSYQAGPCHNGKRLVAFTVKPEMVAICRVAASGLPANTTESCTENPVEVSHTAYILAIFGGIMIALLLVIAVVVAVLFYRKHRTLEYKYSQLSMSTGDIAMTSAGVNVDTLYSIDAGEEEDEEKEEGEGKEGEKKGKEAEEKAKQGSV